MILQYNLCGIFKEKGKEAKVNIAISDNISQRTSQENMRTLMNCRKIMGSKICTTVITYPELPRAVKMLQFLIKHLISQTIAIISKLRQVIAQIWYHDIYGLRRDQTTLLIRQMRHLAISTLRCSCHLYGKKD